MTTREELIKEVTEIMYDQADKAAVGELLGSYHLVANIKQLTLADTMVFLSSALAVCLHTARKNNTPMEVSSKDELEDVLISVMIKMAKETNVVDIRNVIPDDVRRKMN